MDKITQSTMQLDKYVGDLLSNALGGNSNDLTAALKPENNITLDTNSTQTQSTSAPKGLNVHQMLGGKGNSVYEMV